jgi:hypothetical protein
MSPAPKKFKRPDNAPLPKPNVEFAAADDSGEMTPEKILPCSVIQFTPVWDPTANS